MKKIFDTKIAAFKLRFAQEKDVSLILNFIRELAAYENLINEVVATEKVLKHYLFEKKTAEVIIGEYNEKPVSFALFFHNFSTFLGRPGIYLEDLYVQPEMRSKGIGQIMLSFLANMVLDQNYGRLEWWCLDGNEAAINFYQKMNAVPMAEWTVFRVSGKALADLARKYAE